MARAVAEIEAEIRKDTEAYALPDADLNRPSSQA